VYPFENISRKARKEAKNATMQTPAAPLHPGGVARNRINIIHGVQTDILPGSGDRF
jgi:hypothetical protein